MENNIKTVLSVDMDFVMKPIINAYNSFTGSNNPDAFWDNMNQIRDLDKLATIDENNFKYIIKIITKALQNKDVNIIFAEHHDYILEQLTENITKDTKYKLINIDHHHDIYYGDNQMRDVDRYDLPGVGSWVWYLDKYKLLNRYTWIGNDNSYEFEGKPLEAPYFEFRDMVDLEILKLERVDYLFICKSRGWIPPMFYKYFEYIKEMVEGFTNTEYEVNIDNYCRGVLSRPLNLKE